MKALFLFPAIAVFILLANIPSLAQTEKGTKLVGGGARMHISDGYFSAGIFPNAGLFVKDNFVLGASLPLHYSGHSNGSSIQLGLTPFARHYFGKGPTRLFALAALGYSHDWRHRKHEDHTSSSGYGTGSVGVGLVYFLTNQIGVEARVTYDGFIRNDNYLGSVNFGLGFQIYLPQAK
jgi:hypothetical protein